MSETSDPVAARRRGEALRTAFWALLIFPALWFLAPRWLHLRDLLLAAGAAAQALELALQFTTHDWREVRAEWKATGVPNPSARLWEPGLDAPRSLVFSRRAAGVLNALAFGGLAALVVLGFIPGFGDTLAKIFTR